MKVLFVCKKGSLYSHFRYTRRSCGLYNSTSFIVHALRARGVHAHIVEVQDNNSIDREVHNYKPDVVVVEALWVVPEKFPVLMALHPNVTWACHLHSNMPFLAQEGIAMDWLIRYDEMGIRIIANSEESFEALEIIISEDNLANLPNVYTRNQLKPVCYDNNKPDLNVACFGAIRPMKNHLTQALAALKFARARGKYLKFYVNATRIEHGDSVFKNLKQLFEHQEDAELVQSGWYEPDEFIHFLHNVIDIGLQVSMTETFNVVSADYITAGLPIVVSKKVKWVSSYSQVDDPEDINDIVKRMRQVLGGWLLTDWNQYLLRSHSSHAGDMWAEYMEEIP